jgi:hypothetical protein
MKYRYSIHAQEVMENRNIKAEWVETVLSAPSVKKSVSKDEVHFYGQINDYEARCLKVVANPEKKVIVTVYFDRGMRKRGCK